MLRIFVKLTKELPCAIETKCKTYLKLAHLIFVDFADLSAVVYLGRPIPSEFHARTDTSFGEV
jgi:hypothetical protein